MKLSNMGRVVIIDDKFEDTKPLMEVLGKENIPYLYYNGNLEELPENPFTGIRFVFLDIELEGMSGQNKKTKASGSVGRLGKIISKDNGPYVIIAWTKHSEILPLIEENCEKAKIPPVFVIDIEKSNCRTEDGKFDLAIISDKLKEQLEKVGAFQLYVDWENMLNHAGKEFISDITQYFFPPDDKWSKKTEFLFYKLYKTYVEKEELSDENDKLRCAFHLINRGFLDVLENKTIEYENKNFRLTGGKLEPEIIAQINRSLFVSDTSVTPAVNPGNVYEEEMNDMLNLLKKDCFKKMPEDIHLQLCSVIITPQCDIAQKKLLMHRVVYGVFYEKSEKIKIKSAAHLFSVGPIWHKDKIQYIMLNFQTISSIKPDEINNANRIFSLKNDLISDIQTKVGNHVNRLGNFMLK
ncbi:hypothetical protein QUF72_22325 [Desulfobacterales bacterium HSG2]|nr:hypothetical protein [Desulfobacterales bacterium HSG2]